MSGLNEPRPPKPKLQGDDKKSPAKPPIRGGNSQKAAPRGRMNHATKSPGAGTSGSGPKNRVAKD